MVGDCHLGGTGASASACGQAEDTNTTYCKAAARLASCWINKIFLAPPVYLCN